MTLNDVPMRQTVTVRELRAEGSIRRRLLDLGITPKTTIEPVHTSPSGSMRAYFVKGTMIALRDSESREIWVE